LRQLKKVLPAFLFLKCNKEAKLTFAVSAVSSHNNAATPFLAREFSQRRVKSRISCLAKMGFQIVATQSPV
jgi:hypothetical protein